MSDTSPLTSATPTQLAALVEGNLYSMFRASAGALGGEVEETARLSRFYCAPNSPIFKGVWGARLAAGEADAMIEETIAWYKARRAPFFFWWVDAATTPANLGERLQAHGLNMFEQYAPAMVADIETLNWNNPRPSELRVSVVNTEAQLLQWKQVFINSFGIPEFAGQAWVEATLRVGFERAPWQLLLGTLNDEAACCGLLYCGAGVAGLIGLGTLPAFRKRGLGSAMQLERLRIARELGYRYTVLFASEVGRSPYLKLGFHDTGRTISRYLWVAA